MDVKDFGDWMDRKTKDLNRRNSGDGGDDGPDSESESPPDRIVLDIGPGPQLVSGHLAESDQQRGTRVVFIDNTYQYTPEFDTNFQLDNFHSWEYIFADAFAVLESGHSAFPPNGFDLITMRNLATSPSFTGRMDRLCQLAVNHLNQAGEIQIIEEAPTRSDMQILNSVLKKIKSALGHEYQLSSYTAANNLYTISITQRA